LPGTWVDSWIFVEQLNFDFGLCIGTRYVRAILQETPSSGSSDFPRALIVVGAERPARAMIGMYVLALKVFEFLNILTYPPCLGFFFFFFFKSLL
jgi:hypothetical protein